MTLDTLTDNRPAQAANAASRVRREATYVEGAHPIFGWLHHAEAPIARDCVAVVCAPLAHEYTRAHRSMRHLADRLARRGIPAFRFDYHGIGDSPGSDLDPDRLAAWLASVKTAIERARQWSGRQRVCLIGVRLGATLAALVASEMPIDLLVLWNPVVRARGYLRELQAIAMSAERVACEIDGALESAGFVMTAQTLESLRKIDLTTLRPKAGRVLLLDRDDLAPDASLREHLDSCGIATDSLRAPGWAGMMAEHQFTVVPDQALDSIVAWVEKGSDYFSKSDLTPFKPQSTTFEFQPEEGAAVRIEERPCRLGADGHLFGILTQPAVAQQRPAIVLFNAGAVHHVGPNRIYVTIARNLAAMGFPCLRFDLEGIGDSVRRFPGRENHPYPDTALADAGAALAYLRETCGYRSFVAMGLCSGAHTAFHAGLTLENDALREVVLINPLTFYWAEGMSLETTRNFEDAVAYKRSMRDPRRWLKLLRGNVNVRRLLVVMAAQAKTKVKSQLDALAETFLPDRGPPLSRDLKKLVSMQRPVSFFIAEGDPGRDILMAGAGRTATKSLKSGALSLEMIPGADHTFSQFKPRKHLMSRLGIHLRRHGSAS
jgi:alpha-beta hydrolase superfamily lysophospholipase